MFLFPSRTILLQLQAIIFLERKKGELELIHAKNMKISCKNILCKDSCQKYEDLIQKYLVQRI
jgi:hypothetical protein